MSQCYFCRSEGMLCTPDGVIGVCESCMDRVQVVCVMIMAPIIRAFRRIIESDEFRRLAEFIEKIKPLQYGTVEYQVAVQKYQAQRRASFAGQCPPPALSAGRTVTPRARCNLPRGMRKRFKGE